MTSDFEAELRSSLAAIPAIPSHDLAQAAGEGHHHRKKQRRKATRALMAAIPALALVAGGAAIAIHGTGSTPPAATHPAVLTAAYVTKKAEAALSSGNVDKYIIQYSRVSDGVSYTTWTDPVTGSVERVKKSAKDTVTEWVDKGRPFTQVDAAAKTVYAASGTVVYPLENVPAPSPSAMRQTLATGQGTIAVEGVIDGQPVIDLRVPAKHITPGTAVQHLDDPTIAMPGDYWVSAKTFQMVKVVITAAGNPYDGTTYYQWLPRTKSLVAQVNTPQIPAGYRQVSAPSNGVAAVGQAPRGNPPAPPLLPRSPSPGERGGLIPGSAAQACTRRCDLRSREIKRCILSVWLIRLPSVRQLRIQKISRS